VDENPYEAPNTLDRPSWPVDLRTINIFLALAIVTIVCSCVGAVTLVICYFERAIYGF
jgi:hypothetical protein